MASRRTQGESVREFRSKISKLKKAGLIGQNVDARKIQPTAHYKSLVRKFDSVIKGTQTTVKIPRAKARRLRDEGGNVKGDRAIIDKFPGQKIIKSKKDIFGFRVQFPDQIQAVEIDGPRGKSLTTYLNRVEKEAAKMKRTGKQQRFAFRFYGNKSRKTFSTLQQLRDSLEHYSSIEDAEDDHDRALMEEQIASLTIYQIPANQKWHTLPRKRLGRKNS